MLKKLFLSLILLAPIWLKAQNAVTGTVFDFDNNTFPLQYVRVKNLSNQQLTLTKADGQFSISGRVGDLLEFSLMGYHTDTLYLINLLPKRIYLPGNSNNLKEVAIVGAKINPSVLAPDPSAVAYKRLMPDALRGKGNNDRAGGLLFNLGYGKYKRQQEKIRVLEERDRFLAEINEVFTEAYVSNLVKLKGQELKDFMAMYRPPEELVKSERPFNYDLYTVKAYHTWLKLPPEQRKLSVMPMLKAN